MFKHENVPLPSCVGCKHELRLTSLKKPDRPTSSDCKLRFFADVTISPLTQYLTQHAGQRIMPLIFIRGMILNKVLSSKYDHFDRYSKTIWVYLGYCSIQPKFTLSANSKTCCYMICQSDQINQYQSTSPTGIVSSSKLKWDCRLLMRAVKHELWILVPTRNWESTFTNSFIRLK